MKGIIEIHKNIVLQKLEPCSCIYACQKIFGQWPLQNDGSYMLNADDLKCKDLAIPYQRHFWP